MGDLGDQLTAAKVTLSQLATYAKSVGDLPTMYAANRAWHQIDAAERDMEKRRKRLAVSNGHPGGVDG